MQQNKRHVEGLRILAHIASEAQILDDAEFMLDSAVVFEPEHVGAKFDLVTVLLKRQKFADAHDRAKELIALDPENPEFITVLGSARMGIGDIDGAVDCFQSLIERGINLKSAYLLLGHALETAGQLEIGAF